MSFEIQGRRRKCVQEPRLFIIEPDLPGVLHLRFPPPGEKRVRKVVTRSRARQTQKYPSWKMDRMIECESGNELVASRIYDLDTDVLSFHEQAVAIHYWMDGDERVHIPDFVVRRPKYIDIDEIKDTRDAENSDVLERARYLTPLLARLGLRYRVRFIDKDRFRRTLGFCRSVLKYGRSEIGATEREAARRLFASNSDLTWGDVADGCLGERSRYIAARLLLEGEIGTDDCRRPLQPHTRLCVTKEAKGQHDLWAA